MPVWVATRMVSSSFMVNFAIAALSPHSTVLNGSVDFPFRMPCDRGNTVEAIDHLRVHWLLHPRRAVLIEGGDARLGGTNCGLPFSVVAFTNSTIAFLAASVVPRRQRIRLGICLREHQKK